MNEYIFYTPEGFTQDPNGNDIENCQMLGTAKGKDEAEAKEKLLKENPWILEAGFDPCEFMVRQLATEMKIYQVEIIETNCRVESVEAKSEAEAITKVKAAYENGEIVLTDENSCVDVNFNPV